MMSSRKYLRGEHKYEFSLTLPVHPEQKGTRDPRKVWMYDCMSGQFSVEDGLYPNHNDRTYYFSNETDLLVFQLRWEGK